jgi:hypothetical protein
MCGSAPMKALFRANRERDPECHDATHEGTHRRTECSTKRVFILFAGLAVCTWAPGALGEQPPVVKGHVDVIPLHQLPPSLRQAEMERQAEVARQAVLNQSSTPAPLTTWNYSVVAYDGKTYTGSIMGRSPYYNGKMATNIPTQIIPLIITITDKSGTVVYDPTVSDTCLPTSDYTPVSVITGSPLFSSHD